MSRGIAAGLLLSLVGCVHYPEPYRPPIQRRPAAGPDTSRLTHFVSMNEPAAPDHFLRDIRGLEGNAFRWAGQYPTLRFVVPATTGLKLRVDFAITEETFRRTGPLHVAFLVNGKQLDRVRYDSPGSKRFEKPVDASWLVARDDNIVKLDVEKWWLDPATGEKFGVTLGGAGFVE